MYLGQNNIYFVALFKLFQFNFYYYPAESWYFERITKFQINHIPPFLLIPRFISLIWETKSSETYQWINAHDSVPISLIIIDINAIL